MSRVVNYGRLFCNLNLNHNAKIRKKLQRIASAAPLKTFLYQFKRVNNFFAKNSFNCESSNLIYVAIYQGCKEEYIEETGCPVKQNKYLQTTYKTALISTIGNRRACMTCGDRKFHVFFFSQDS